MSDLDKDDLIEHLTRKLQRQKEIGDLPKENDEDLIRKIWVLCSICLPIMTVATVLMGVVCFLLLTHR